MFRSPLLMYFNPQEQKCRFVCVQKSHAGTDFRRLNKCFRSCLSDNDCYQSPQPAWNRHAVKMLSSMNRTPRMLCTDKSLSRICTCTSEMQCAKLIIKKLGKGYSIRSRCLQICGHELEMSRLLPFFEIQCSKLSRGMLVI